MFWPKLPREKHNQKGRLCTFRKVALNTWTWDSPPKIGFLSTPNARRDVLWFSVTVQSWSKLLQCTESRLRDAKVWGRNAPDQYQATIYEGTKPTPGLRLHPSTVSFFLRPQLWNGTREVALISRAVASPFSYRYKKKCIWVLKKKKGVNKLLRSLAFKIWRILETGYLINEARLCSGSMCAAERDWCAENRIEDS